MANRVVPPSFFLPAPQTPRDRALNQALVDMYRPVQRRLDDSIQSGTIAEIPTSTGSNRIYWATDTSVLYFDGPSGWEQVVAGGAVVTDWTIEVPAAGDVDPWLQFTITATANYRMGIDDSDSDAFVIANSTALGTTNFFRYASGAFTLSGTLGVGAITSTGAVAGTSLSAGAGTIGGGATTITTLACTTITATGNTSITRSASGSTVSLLNANTSNTASSHALISARVAGTSAGDAVFTALINGSTTWSWGLDNSATDAFVLSNSATLGTTNMLEITTGGTVTLPFGTLIVTKSTAGADNVIRLENTSNTASSGSLVDITVAGTSAADPYVTMSVTGTTSWSFGVDNDDSDSFKICVSSALDTTNDLFSLTTGGQVTFKRPLTGAVSTAQAAMQVGLDAGTQNAGSGPSILFYGDDSGGAKEFMGRVSAIWETPTAGSETAGVQFAVRGTAADTNAQTVALKMLADKSIVGGIINGGQWAIQSATESLTIDADPKDTTANLLPANSIILGVTTRVTTALTNVTAFSVGDPTTAARFSAAAGGVALGSTRVCIDHWSGAVTTLAAGPSQAAAAKVRIDRTAGAGTPAGVVEIVVYALVFTPPTS